MYKFVAIAVISSVLFPAAAGAQSFSRVLAATDPSLAGAFTAAMKSQPALKASAPSLKGTETKAEYEAIAYAPITRSAVYDYEYTSSAFQGKKTLRLEYGQYSERDGLVTVTLTVFDRGNARSASYQMQYQPHGIAAGGSPFGGPRVEMPSPVVYNFKWDDGYSSNRVAAVNTTATAPAGSFKGCVRIISRLAGDGGTINRYYAPGVGLVLEQLVSAGKLETISLLSYQLK